MVLLAAAVCTKGGKPLISRQFVEMTRPRVEGLYLSFPKLINESKGQHTFIDTDTIRYVYQPLENLFLVLLTSLNSNIVEDLETLHMFARLIPEYTDGLTEQDVAKNAFELISAFDEVVSMGYRESVNLHQIKTYTEMDSHNERMQEMLRKSKEEETKAEAKRWREKHKKELEMNRKMGISGTTTSGSGYTPSRGSSSSGMGGSDGYSRPSNMGSSRGSSHTSPVSSPRSYDQARKPAQSKGMRLGSKKQDAGTENKMDALIRDAGVKEVTGSRSASRGASTQKQSNQQQDSIETVQEGVVIKSQELLAVTIPRDGGLQRLSIKGMLTVIVTDNDQGPLQVGLRLPEGVATNVHNSCDKQLFQEKRILAFSDPKRTFPVNNQGASLLRWRVQTQDESKTPLVLTCWPSEGSGGCSMSIEYDLQAPLNLKNVTITIPCGNAAPSTCDTEQGFASYDRQAKAVVWEVGDISPDNGKNGNLDFSCKNTTKDTFFPINANFKAEGSMCGVNILGARNSESGQGVRHTKAAIVETEVYEVV